MFHLKRYFLLSVLSGTVLLSGCGASMQPQPESSTENLANEILGTAEATPVVNGISSSLFTTLPVSEKKEQTVPTTIEFPQIGNSSISVLLQGDYACIVDTGNAENWEQISGYLDQLQFSRASVFITSLNENYVGNLLPILRRYQDQIDFVCFPLLQTSSPYTAAAISFLEKQDNIRVIQAAEGTDYDLNDAFSLRLFFPAEGVNCYRFETYDDTTPVSVLFCGNVSLELDPVLAARSALTSDLLLLPLSGDYLQFSDDLINAISPAYAIIPNNQSLPLNQYSALKALDTATFDLSDGSVVVRIEDDTISVLPEQDIGIPELQQETQTENTKSLALSDYVFFDGSHFHSERTCSERSGSSLQQLTLQAAITRSLSPCEKCIQENTLPTEGTTEEADTESSTEDPAETSALSTEESGEEPTETQPKEAEMEENADD